MSQLLVCLVLLCLALPSRANLCKENKIDERHAVEASLIGSEPYSLLLGSSAGDYMGSADYNARLIACNRSRDSLGRPVERAYQAGQTFLTTLSTRAIAGTISYYNFAPARYGYLLSRRGSSVNSSTWTLTAIARFGFPGAIQRRKVDLPWELAQELGIDAECRATSVLGSSGTTRTDLGWMDVDPQNGAVDSGDACRVAETRTFTNSSVVPPLTGSATTHLAAYWKRGIERRWSRPGFEVKFLIDGHDRIPRDVITRLDGSTVVAPGSTTTINIVWNLQFNHMPQTRVTYKPVIGKPNPFYEGTAMDTIVHEFGHAVGLDDEYSEPFLSSGGYRHQRQWRECGALGGGDYVMCKGDMVNSNDQKSVYPWLLTRRYAIGVPFSGFCPNFDCGAATTTRPLAGTAVALTRCRADSDCAPVAGIRFFCDKNFLGRGDNTCSYLRSECSPCTRDGQCATGHCDGKPDGKCAPPKGTGTFSAGNACCRDSQCSSGRCKRTVGFQFGECRP